MKRTVFTILTRSNTTTKHPLVVIGGGSGGIGFVNNFMGKAAHKELRLKDSDIAIVEPANIHYYQPGLTLVGGGLETINNLHRSTISLLPKNVTFYNQAAVVIDPDQMSVTLTDGSVVRIHFFEILSSIIRIFFYFFFCKITKSKILKLKGEL